MRRYVSRKLSRSESGENSEFMIHDVEVECAVKGMLGGRRGESGVGSGGFFDHFLPVFALCANGVFVCYHHFSASVEQD